MGDEDLARMAPAPASEDDLEAARGMDAGGHGEDDTRDAGDEAAEKKEGSVVFDDRSLTQYPSRSGSLDDESIPLPPKSDLEKWITRGVPPRMWGDKVVSTRPFMRRRMARLLSEKPREVKNVWSGGLLGCFDDGASCILTCFCPCIQFGMNMAYNQHDHFRCCGYSFRSKTCFSSCIIQALVWFFIPALLIVPFFVLHYYLCEGERGFPFDGAGPFECKYWWLTGGVSLGRIPLLIFAAKYGGYFRKKMREKYALPDDPFGEYFFYIVLWSCAICQEARTIKQLERRRRLEAVLADIEEEEKAALLLPPPPGSGNDDGTTTTMVAPSAGSAVMDRGAAGDAVVVGVPVKAFDEVGPAGAQGSAAGGRVSEDDDVPVAIVVVE